ncbi:MAG: hypothetical protein ACLUGA_07930 [Oscillospiraceae bacterium]
MQNIERGKTMRRHLEINPRSARAGWPRRQATWRMGERAPD